MHASTARTPTILTAGANDRCTSAGQAREFYQALINHSVDSELVIYPGEGNCVRRFPAVTDYLTRLVTLFERALAGPVRRWDPSGSASARFSAAGRITRAAQRRCFIES
jgi:dipeptidyl aminopeptidase/acylaminoacyl peptidase